MREEIFRLVDSIHRDRGVDKETLFQNLEGAIEAAARKKYGHTADIRIEINRESGDIIAMNGDEPIKPEVLGRIAAQVAKQVMMQKFREAESDVVFDEYQNRVNTLVSGNVQRFDHGNIIVNLGRAEGVLPRSEQVPTETYRPGERVRCYVVSVKKKGSKVVIILSRTHPNLVKELFALEVPEISDRVIEIKGIVREPGYRTKIAMYSVDSRVDCVGACVGVRGARIRNIVDELNGEKIDIVPWNDTPEVLIVNSLSPAEVSRVEFDRETKRARVVVPDDQLSLAIGKRGQNVRLTAKLTNLHIDVITTSQAKQEKERKALFSTLLEQVDDFDPKNIALLNKHECDTVGDVLGLGVAKLAELEGLNEESAQAIVDIITKFVEGGLSSNDETVRTSQEDGDNEQTVDDTIEEA